ncbi:hypothetical protein [Flavobacterium geliluteum]|uniref:Uncharacterized protein n=1 Tax=Flavobacterium geliluteum TaxID=2816120 RepID=A0A940XCP7_9FLAO|nr:hypothetical protein [Flavobacterium geliluteum]MBP4137234.1 hypothetical protein [Flavobacterium geliluteum]
MEVNLETVQALIDYLLLRNKDKLLLGFYGDSHQKIYDIGIGSLQDYVKEEKNVLTLIKKEENYRSSKAIVNLLNNFRTNIQQEPKKDILGSTRFIYWANHPNIAPKQKVRDFEDSLKANKNEFYNQLLEKLVKSDWNFTSDSEDKILVLANSRIAERAGFLNLYKIYSQRYGQSTKERLLDRNHFLIKIFSGYIDKKKHSRKSNWFRTSYGILVRKQS